VSSHRLVRKDHLVLIAVITVLVITSSSISTYGYFDITKVVYGQTDPDQTNSNTTNSVNLQDIPLEKVRVGDIDIAYKMFGKGDPIILIAGLGGKMDSWDPSLLNALSTNHTVIVFDNRGMGNTTAGSKPYTTPLAYMSQLANDTAGLLDALEIPKADVLGYSLGSMIAQQFTVTHPEMLNRLLLVAASCGGKESIPHPPEVTRLDSEMLNKSFNNVPITRQDQINTMYIANGPAWMQSHPNLVQGVPEQNISAIEMLGGMPPDTFKKFDDAVAAWKFTNWSGVCDKLTTVSSPTLIMSGTDDIPIPPANSLIIASKIPGAWLVHIKDAGHAIMDQYPAEVAEIVNTFLSTTGQSS
jgi:pimeloyl-ACP methyl ester carboxylesterase